MQKHDVHTLNKEVNPDKICMQTDIQHSIKQQTTETAITFKKL